MILSDKDILARIEKGDIIITCPRDNYKDQIHASSMDMRLGKYFKVYKHSQFAMLDPKNPMEEEITEMIEVEEGKPFIVQPGEFVLGVTEEKVKVPNDLVARVEGRSSLGRLGLLIHATAGFVDAGFEGTITLEIGNVNRMPIAIYPGQRICQLAFEQMTSEALVPYGDKKCSKYQGQVLPEESRVMRDPEFL
ncbi:dCTP deaminase [Candidatus Peregrinibacteria bacterium]|jgi:dCTP deaminase|nr:dCTP deaminase [Candidatus Peregrinibacteria bacterium]